MAPGPVLPGCAIRHSLIAPLPLPCVYYDRAFLSPADADRYLALLSGDGIEWATSGVSKRPTALYGDEGLDYHGPRRDHVDVSIGYASDRMHSWTPPLRELKAAAEAWHLRETGLAVSFSVCLLNRFIAA